MIVRHGRVWPATPQTWCPCASKPACLSEAAAAQGAVSLSSHQVWVQRSQGIAGAGHPASADGAAPVEVDAVGHSGLPHMHSSASAG